MPEVPDTARRSPGAAPSLPYCSALSHLQEWIERHDYAGFEPYDLLNSPFLQSRWARKRLVAPFIIQAGRRFGGLRRWLRVPPSRNPKTLALCLLAYCDLQRQGEDCFEPAQSVKNWLIRLKSPAQESFSWGYDWDFVSLRGTALQKFRPNCIATYFCANALLEMAEVFGDTEAHALAQSAGNFLARGLNRSVNTADHICFSYTQTDRTQIFNSSALAGALLARLATGVQKPEYLSLASRSLRYLADQQRGDGSWTYGAGPMQKWNDGFHTGYNLCALLEYRAATGDTSFDQHLDRGYTFYKRSFFRQDGAPKYLHNRLYPIDIHSCSQAILTFCAFHNGDSQALKLAQRTADWTIANMQSPEGTFFYQRRRVRTDRTPYMRWGQAWMFRALARLQATLVLEGGDGKNRPKLSVSPDGRH